MVASISHEQLPVAEERLGAACCTSGFARNAFVFLAGAEAFHTISHVWLALSGMLPMEIQFPSMTVTQGLNVFAIFVNAIITIALLYGAKRLTK